VLKCPLHRPKEELFLVAKELKVLKFEPTGSKVKIGASMSNSYDKENKNPAAFMGTGVVIMQILDDKFEYDLYKVLRSNKYFYTGDS
jgi:hypothetical protein